MPSRTVSFYVELDYNFDGTFTDESDNVVSFNVERSISGIGNPFLASSGRIDRAVVTLSNIDRRFNSKVDTGALYSLIQDGQIFHVPIRVGINTGGSDYRIFTGICKIPVEPNANPKSGRNIQITAYSNEEKHINNRLSLSVDQAYAWYNDLPTESETINFILDTIGESGYTLESGIYPIFPYYFEKSAMQILWDVAKSGGGFLFTDRLGKFRFFNASHFAGVSSLETFSRDQFGQVTLSYPDINLAKTIKINGETVAVGASKEVFNAGSTYTIPPNDSLEIEIAFDDPSYNIINILYDALSLSGADISADISLAYSFTVESAILTFTSVNAGYCIITNLVINGVPFEFTSFKVTKISGETFWSDRVNSNLVTNVNGTYIQSEAVASSLGNLILGAQQYPNAMLQIQDLVYDSSLELLDVITIFDNTVSTEALDIVITDLDYSFAASSGARINVKGIDLSKLYPYLVDGVSEYFIIGTNELGSTATLKGRLFY